MVIVPSLTTAAVGLPFLLLGFITQETTPAVTIGGEMVVVRTDQAIAKAYNFAFGTSSTGQVCFVGPFKNFEAHHSPAVNPAPVASMFGHVTIPKR